MKYTARSKLYYKFELFMSKGGSSVFLSILIVFICGFLFISAIRFLLVNLFPEKGVLRTIWESIWTTFLQMTDPGSMQEEGVYSFWIRLSAILAGIIGIIVLSMLIAVITTSLETILYNFRKGRGKIIETGHTLILGWNERVVDIIRELIIANESERKASVVVLSKEEKEVMDDLLAKRLTETKTTRIVTTNGSISNINELKRVNINNAKSIIVLANCSERACSEAKINSDVQSIKSIMAIISAQGGINKLPVIAEIYTKEKQEIISHFMDNKIMTVNSWDIMGRLLMQTSLTSGLEIVYNEILSFRGCEIYFHQDNWKGINFYDLVFHFNDGIPLGIYNDVKGLILKPPKETKLNKDDKLVILAEDNSVISFSDKKLYHAKELELVNKKLKKQKKKILILGWHFVANIFIREANNYLIEGTGFDIMFNNPSPGLKEIVVSLQKKYSKFKINLIDANPLKFEHLENVNPGQYDNIIILSQNLEESSPDKIDSDTLIILLLLRRITKYFKKTNIITQVLNSDNKDIITQTDVDDFIISNKLITMILAQLSEEPLIKVFYDDIFSEEGSEIYVKPATLYFNSFPKKVAFIDVIQVVHKRNEICLGIQKGDHKKSIDLNFGVLLNLPKNKVIEINENDFFIVLAENEL